MTQDHDARNGRGKVKQVLIKKLQRQFRKLKALVQTIYINITIIFSSHNNKL